MAATQQSHGLCWRAGPGTDPEERAPKSTGSWNRARRSRARPLDARPRLPGPKPPHGSAGKALALAPPAVAPAAVCLGAKTPRATGRRRLESGRLPARPRPQSEKQEAV